MPVWKCGKCAAAVTAEIPPERCSSCGEQCDFLDVTCYLPECGGSASGNVNPQAFERSGGGGR